MSDTLHLTHKELDSLIQHSMQHVMEENQAKAYDQPILGIVFLGLGAISILFMLRRTMKAKKFEAEHKRNFKDVGIWFFIVSVIFAGLYFQGWIHPVNKNGFFISHGDVLLITVSIIALIGAVWAIYARIDAEKAFKESILTRLSFGNSFSFPAIFMEEGNNKRLPHIINKIHEDNYTVSLYIGFPCIGHFYRKSSNYSEDRIDPDEVNKNFYLLIKKLDAVITDTSASEYTINLGIFDDKEIKKCFPDSDPEIAFRPPDSLSGDPSRNLLEDWQDVIKRLKEKVDEEVKKNSEWGKKKKVNFIPIKREDERFRFASVSVRNTVGLDQRLLENLRALIWVVPDFYHTNTLEFTSAGFQTSDISIIEMLEKVFAMEKHTAKPALQNLNTVG
jgi:hypothetical protein